MASNLTITVGTQLLFNVSGSYGPATLNDLRIGSPTDVVFDFTSIATLNAEQSTKADFTANRAPEYAVHAALEFATAPAIGETVDFYWAPSVSGTAGQGNPGYATGATGPYTGTPGTLAEGLAQLMYIGSMVMGEDATGTIQMAFIGIFSPPTRYGSLVVVNNTSDSSHSDVDEQAVSFTPIIPQGS